jgi:hypothetical protein
VCIVMKSVSKISNGNVTDGIDKKAGVQPSSGFPFLLAKNTGQ